jgi:hypothetical protein
MITETGVPGEIHNFDAIHKQSVSHTVASTTLPYNRLLKMALFTHNAVTVVVTIEW